MEVTKVSMQFANNFSGTLTGEKVKVGVGSHEGEAMPYELLLGALGACFYATFLSIVRKMRVGFESVDIQIEGTKRDEEPAHLIKTKIAMTITNGESEEKLTKAAHLAEKYCSVYYTVSKVSDMELELKFA